MRIMGGASAAVATVVLLALTGCGSASPGPSSSPTVTVTSTAASTPSSTPSSGGAAPDGPDTSGAPSSGSSTAAADPGRPGDQCPDSVLGVGIRTAPGGGGAGSEEYQLLFTNTGGATCDLRGAPGVSVVGGGNGTQIGPAADRNQSGASTLRLPSGDTVVANLQVTNIGADGGPLGSRCAVRKGDGYRVYPPHSTRAFFVRSATARACADGPVFMTVSVVQPQ